MRNTYNGLSRNWCGRGPETRLPLGMALNLSSPKSLLLVILSEQSLYFTNTLSTPIITYQQVSIIYQRTLKVKIWSKVHYIYSCRNLEQWYCTGYTRSCTLLHKYYELLILAMGLLYYLFLYGEWILTYLCANDLYMPMKNIRLPQPNMKQFKIFTIHKYSI